MKDPSRLRAMNYELQFFVLSLLGLHFGAADQGVYNLPILSREPVPILAERIFHHLPRGAALQHSQSLNQ